MKRNDYDYENFRYTGDSCLILMEEVRYKKNDFGEMILVPDETKEEVISPMFYTNYITAIPFFDDDFFGPHASCEAEWGRTPAGVKPTVVTTINGAGDEKIVATFTFLSKSNLLNTAGWREKEIVKNAKHFHIERADCADMIYFYTESDGDTSEGIFDTKRAIWRG